MELNCAMVNPLWGNGKRCVEEPMRVLVSHIQATRVGNSLLILFTLLLFGGCGYSIQSNLRPEFSQNGGIVVPVFKNETDETGVERIFTNALIREMKSRGGTVLSDRAHSGTEFRGTITSISYVPTGTSDAGFKGLQSYRQLPSEISIQAEVRVDLVDLTTKKSLFSGKFSGFRRLPMPLDRTYDYEAPSAIGLITTSMIESQYPGIARDIMRDIYDAMLAEGS